MGLISASWLLCLAQSNKIIKVKTVKQTPNLGLDFSSNLRMLRFNKL